ncbi:polysaccharide pyruvyl transferase family protein [Vibrio vulnificus]
MKIAILTQPLFNNYGGLLQAYALQKYLKDNGHDVLTVDFYRDEPSLRDRVREVVYNLICKCVLRRPVANVFAMSKSKQREIAKHTARFCAENIKTTQTIRSLSEFDYIKNYGFDAYVVGSDQVWRPIYSPGLPAFFLDFVKGYDVRRIAYAASFGVDNCNEYTQQDLSNYSRSLSQFDAIGVRESSAVDICRESFSVDAIHVIDPTLLLDKSDYSALVEKDQINVSEGNMMVYVLDKNPIKQDMIKKVASIKGLSPFTVMQDPVTGVFPPVTAWLRGFMDAKFVVTDSFHGVAFSIIFNKPFIAIANKGRGLARFTSILELFQLKDRLVFELTDVTEELVNREIDFVEVNNIRSAEIKKTKSFFNSALNAKL